MSQCEHGLKKHDPDTAQHDDDSATARHDTT